MEDNHLGDPYLLEEAIRPSQLRRIQLRSKRTVTAGLLGQYRSAFRGSGLVFSDIREYQPGDDVKHIHWKVTARTGQAYVKAYEEERQLRVMIAVDVSRSILSPQHHSSVSRILEFCSLIGTLTQRGNDLLGATTFSAAIHQLLPPSSGARRSRSILSLLSKIFADEKINSGSPDSTGVSNLKPVIEKLRSTLKKPSLIFILSDFFVPSFERELSSLTARHDVVLVHTGQKPSTLPARGLISFQDTESGETILIDCSNDKVRQSWNNQIKHRFELVQQIATRCNADAIDITDSAMAPLVHLMQRRSGNFSKDKARTSELKP